MKNVVCSILLIFVSSIACSQQSYDSLVRFDEWEQDYTISLKTDSIVFDRVYIDQKPVFLSQNIIIDSKSRILIQSMSDTSILYRQYYLEDEVVIGIMVLDSTHYETYEIPLVTWDGNEDSIVVKKRFKYKRVGTWVDRTKFEDLFFSTTSFYVQGKIDGIITTEISSFDGFKINSTLFDNGIMIYDSLFLIKQFTSKDLCKVWYWNDYTKSHSVKYRWEGLSEKYGYMLFTSKNGDQYGSYFNLFKNGKSIWHRYFKCGTGVTKDDRNVNGTWSFDQNTKMLKIQNFNFEVLFFNGENLIVREKIENN